MIGSQGWLGVLVLVQGRHRAQVLRGCKHLFKPYWYVRESNFLTNFLDHACFAIQNLVGNKNQFAAKITKVPPAEITKP